MPPKSCCRCRVQTCSGQSRSFMEPTTGFEPVTPSLPRKCSTPEPRGLETPVGSPEAGAWTSPTVKPRDPISSPTLCKAPSFAHSQVTALQVARRGRPGKDARGEEVHCARGVPACLGASRLFEQPPIPRRPAAQPPPRRIAAEGRGHVVAVAADQEIAEAAGVAVVVEELRAPLVPLRQQVVPAAAGVEARRGLEQLGEGEENPAAPVDLVVSRAGKIDRRRRP